MDQQHLLKSKMERFSQDIDVIKPNIVKHLLTQEVKEYEGISHLKKNYSPTGRSEKIHQIAFLFLTLPLMGTINLVYTLDVYAF